MTFDDIERVIEESRSAELAEYLKERQLSGEGYQPYYAFFRQLALSGLLPEGIFLEIGCLAGTVAAHVLDVVDRHHKLYIGVDHNEIPYSHGSFIHLHGDSTSDTIHKSVEQLATAYGGIACVFQDSSHHYAASVKEWDLYRPLVTKGGLWICDDITPSFYREGLDEKSMVGYFDDLPGEKKLYDTLHMGSRIGVVLC